MILRGLVAIVEGHGTPEERVIRAHGPGRFLGELGLLTGQVLAFTAVAVEAGEVLEVPVPALREVVTDDPMLGDLILRAYLTRRTLSIGIGAGFRIVGSRFSPDTRRLREFASRNRLLHRFIDVEDDAHAAQLLRRLGVRPDETPVVIWRDRILRNPSNAELAELVGLVGLRFVPDSGGRTLVRTTGRTLGRALGPAPRSVASAGSRCFWKPAPPACSPLATSAAARSSGSPPRSARAPWPSGWYTSTSPPAVTGDHAGRTESPSPPPGPHDGLLAVAAPLPFRDWLLTGAVSAGPRQGARLTQDGACYSGRARAAGDATHRSSTTISSVASRRPDQGRRRGSTTNRCNTTHRKID